MIEVIAGRWVDEQQIDSVDAQEREGRWRVNVRLRSTPARSIRWQCATEREAQLEAARVADLLNNPWAAENETYRGDVLHRGSTWGTS